MLLDAADRWIARVDEQWLRLVTAGAELPRAAWADWPQLVVAEERTARSAAVDAALLEMGLPPGLPGAQAAFEQGRERELAAALVRAGWRAGGPAERDAVLRAAVEAVAATPAVARAGFAWQLSWSGPLALRSPDGSTVALDDLVGRAIGGDWAPLRAAVHSGSAAAPAARPDPQVGVHVPDPVTAGRPVPPMPPFQEVAPGEWEVELSGLLLRKVRIRADAAGLTVNGERFADDDLEHFMMRIADASGHATSVKLSLTGRSGATVGAHMSASTSKGGQPILETVDFLWRFVRAVVGPRRSAALVECLAAGEEVTVGGVVLAPDGIRDVKRPGAPLVPWSSVADPHLDGTLVVIPGFDAERVVVRLDEVDSFLLFDAIPVLRARFGV